MNGDSSGVFPLRDQDADTKRHFLFIGGKEDDGEGFKLRTFRVVVVGRSLQTRGPNLQCCQNYHTNRYARSYFLTK